MLGNDLEVQRMLTRAFIDTMPVALTLVPHERVKTQSGGYREETRPARPVQVMRLIEPTMPSDPLRAADGVQREVSFILLGTHDAEMEVGDRFSFDGDEWELISVFFDNGWERRAAVVQYDR